MNLTAKIVAVGAWGCEFRNWSDLQKILNGETIEDDGAKGPKPDVIPANERRRAPLPVRLAVESSWQATQSSSLNAEDLSCVFVSALGDTQLTDYMCKVLAGENKQLSPTKFHNSVHNAAAGYWTISTGCMKAANSVAGYEESVSLTLLEALTQIDNERSPVLLTFYDAPVSLILKDLLKNDYPFAVSLILVPDSMDIEGINISAEVLPSATEWPLLKTSTETLNALYQSTPTARMLALLEALVNGSNDQIGMPLSAGTSMRLTVG
jgi:hypothetical protein